MGRRRDLECLCSDHQPDVEQDRKNRHQRNQCEQQCGESKEADNSDRDARGERVADAAADRLPARMPNVYRRRERAAEHRADDCAQTVGEQNLTQVIVVAGCRSALHVVHRFGEVVDAQWDRGDQQRRHLRKPFPHIGRKQRHA